MEKITAAVFVTAVLISCSQTDLEKANSRYLSQAIACQTDSLCFAKADSLLFTTGDQLTPGNVEWNSLSRADTIINFHEYSDAGENATILVLDNYEVRQEGKYILRLGSDDGYRIFVNGEEIASRVIGRSLQLDSDWIPIDLQEGTNRLIIQVNQGIGDWKLHYRIDKGANLQSLVEDQLMEIYRDLPDINILSDTSGALTLNKDPRQNLDAWHTIAYSWLTPASGDTISAGSYKAGKAPQTVPLPEKAEFPLLFKYSIYNEVEEVVFSETIPIFSETSVEEYVVESYKKLSMNQGNEQWTKGLELVFPEHVGAERLHSYSTRIKTEFLWDVLIRAGHELKNIGGQYSRAIYYLNRAKEDFNDRNIYLSESLANIKLENYEEAQRLALKALAMFPTHLAPHLLLGEVYYHQGKIEESKAALRKCINMETPVISPEVKQIQQDAREFWESKYRQLPKDFKSDPGLEKER